MCDEPVVLTVDETAALLRISRGSAYEGVRTGDIPSVRVGRRILIPRQPLLDVINRKAGDNHRTQHTEPSDLHQEERKSE